MQIDLPKSETARLALTPLVIHEPTAWQGVGARGILDVTVDDVLVASVPIERGQEVSIPLALRAGTQVVGLSLRAGNFRSVDFGGQDTTVLSYSVQSIDLRLGP